MDNDIKAYDTYRNMTFGEKGLPENVRHELNIDSLCEKIDFTSSCIGRQYLYHIVCKDKISQVSGNEYLIKELHDNISLRKRLVGLLGKLNKPDAHNNRVTTRKAYRLLTKLHPRNQHLPVATVGFPAMHLYKQHSGTVSYTVSCIIYSKLLSASETKKSAFIILFLHTTAVQTFTNSKRGCRNQHICRYGQKYPSVYQQPKRAGQETALIPYKY